MISELTDEECSAAKRKSESIVSHLQNSDRLGHASYICVVILWVFYAAIAFSVSGESFARSGAGLVLLATFVSGIHLFLVDQSKMYFAYARTGGLHDGGKTETQKQTAADLWEANLTAADIENDVVSKVIRWEVGLATLGTFVWGYGDLFVSKTIDCGEWTC